MLQCFGACSAAAGYKDCVYGTCTVMGAVDIQSAYVPRNKLSVRDGNKYSAQFLCRDWMREQKWYSCKRFKLSGSFIQDRICCI